MDDIWPPSEQVPEDPNGQSQGEQQGRRLVEGQTKSQDTDHLHQIAIILWSAKLHLLVVAKTVHPHRELLVFAVN